ncbi:MAG: sirohydrochlorin cobaltochelatase [Desulfobacteraceae bacterium 4572_88]|nr:MAG: sirohydrochlorin cobaltochelatase [Desulfobacteraceae bacterium 4572_88]
MKIPIVMAAFGTTTRAMKTYSFINNICKQGFPDHEILWAYSSRMVRDFSKKKRNTNMRLPHEVLAELREKGHSWAVVQSLHLMCGHEFCRLVEEVSDCDIRTSVGLPLLFSPEDYLAVSNAIRPMLSGRGDEAIVLVGHGTDHPSWACYVALSHMLAETFGQGVYMGVVEDGYPSREMIIAEVRKAGFAKVRLLPFMLIAGVHFAKDLMGDEDSWKTAFEREGIAVSAESKGLGFHEGIVDIFCNHVSEAMDVIPR